MGRKKTRSSSKHSSKKSTRSSAASSHESPVSYRSSRRTVSDASSAASSSAAASSTASSNDRESAASYRSSHAPSRSSSAAHRECRNAIDEEASSHGDETKSLDIVDMMSAAHRIDATLDEDVVVDERRATRPLTPIDDRADSMQHPTFRNALLQHTQLPQWPWNVMNAMESATERAALEFINNPHYDNQRIVSGLRDVLHAHASTTAHASVPRYGASFSEAPAVHGVLQPQLQRAHELDSKAWKQQLSTTILGILEQLNRMTGHRADITQKTMAQLDAIDRVREIHEGRAASLTSPTRRANAMRIIKARVAYAVQQLENHMRTRLRDMQREMLARQSDAPKMRGLDANDSALKQVLETVVHDDAQLTNTMGALEAHHRHAVSEELEKWNMFLMQWSTASAKYDDHRFK